MMQRPPELKPFTETVLRIILARNSIDGSSLMKEVGVSRADDLIEALQELRNNRLIEVGGRITPDELPFSRIAVMPSAKSYINNMFL
jgi:hypothetical protein